MMLIYVIRPNTLKTAIWLKIRVTDYAGTISAFLPGTNSSPAEDSELLGFPAAPAGGEGPEPPNFLCET
jgi:hypothetical protein